MKVNKLITHINPDLDAMMSVLLMRKFGEKKFPNVSKAEIIFVSAGKLPDGKSAKKLEKEGILTLDTGGGRFDTHPTGNNLNADKRDLSATDLVAKYLNVIKQDNSWEELIKYTSLHDTTGHSLYSRDYLHHLMSIHTILLGLENIYKSDSKTKLEIGIEIISSIPEFVRHKEQALNFETWFENIATKYFKENLIKKDVENEDAYSNLIKWYQNLKENQSCTFSKNKFDEIVSIKSIVLGAYFKSNYSEQYAYKIFNLCMQAIIKREKLWFNALKEIDSDATLIKKIGKIKIVSIQSKNGLVIKAARYKAKADLILFRDAINLGTTILINRNSILRNFDMKKLAAKIRIAESFEDKIKPNFGIADNIGEQLGWFVHQSENFIIKGSSKATDFIPSKISLKNLSAIIYDLVASEYNVTINGNFIPDKYNKILNEYSIYQLKKKFKFSTIKLDVTFVFV